MLSAKILILAGMVAMMTACGPAEWLNPCYNNADVTLDAGLLGRWNGSDGNGNLRFEIADDKAYTVVYTDVQENGSRDESTFEGHLVRLGGMVFLDVVPEQVSADPGAYSFAPAPSHGESLLQPRLVAVGKGLYASLIRVQQASSGSDDASYELHLIQGHWVFRVWLDGGTLRLADLDEDWFNRAVETGKVEIGHDEVDDTLVLTASTPELRAFILEHGGDEGAFPEPDDGWSRQK